MGTSLHVVQSKSELGMVLNVELIVCTPMHWLTCTAALHLGSIQRSLASMINAPFICMFNGAQIFPESSAAAPASAGGTIPGFVHVPER